MAYATPTLARAGSRKGHRPKKPASAWVSSSRRQALLRPGVVSPGVGAASCARSVIPTCPKKRSPLSSISRPRRGICSSCRRRGHRLFPERNPGPRRWQASTVLVRAEGFSARHPKALSGTGLRLESVSVRSFGLLAHWLSGAGKVGPVANAILVAMEGGGELTVVRSSELLFSRKFSSAADQSENPSALLPELRRSLGAYANSFPEQPVQTIFVADEAGTLLGDLQRELELSVKAFTPLLATELKELSPSVRSSFAPDSGNRPGPGSRPATGRFFAPQARRGADGKKKNISGSPAWPCWACFWPAAVWCMAWRRRPAMPKSTNSGPSRKVCKNKPSLWGTWTTDLEAVTRWAGARLVVLDELYDLIARFPDQAGMPITRVASASVLTTPASALILAPAKGSGGKQARSGGQGRRVPAAAPGKEVGQLTLEVRADTADALESMRLALLEEKHWKLDLWEHENLGSYRARATLKVFPRSPPRIPGRPWQDRPHDRSSQ